MVDCNTDKFSYKATKKSLKIQFFSFQSRFLSNPTSHPLFAHSDFSYWPPHYSFNIRQAPTLGLLCPTWVLIPQIASYMTHLLQSSLKCHLNEDYFYYPYTATYLLSIRTPDVISLWFFSFFLYYLSSPNITWFIYYIYCVLSPLIEGKIHKSRNFCLFCFLMYPNYLEHCLVHSTYLINIGEIVNECYSISKIYPCTFSN